MFVRTGKNRQRMVESMELDITSLQGHIDQHGSEHEELIGDTTL
jgi:hypothetical protein